MAAAINSRRFTYRFTFRYRFAFREAAAVKRMRAREQRM
jgi:hypothetical protein